MVGYKACPLCEKADRVIMMTRALFDTVVEEHGNSMLDMGCRRCDITVSDYNNTNDPYDVVHDRLATKWNSLPRWEKMCIKFVKEEEK